MADELVINENEPLELYRYTKRTEDMLPGATCRIKCCHMENYLEDIFEQAGKNYDSDVDMCENCPLFTIVNTLAEYEDLIELVGDPNNLLP